MFQESLAKSIGALSFEKNQASFPKAVSFLLEGVKTSVCGSVSQVVLAFTGTFQPRTTIEARRACYVSIPLVISDVFPRLLHREHLGSI